ncbi:hypothetical protein NP233_g4856 [Leucocoprinus birnbaumii]|uniref:non-specific serine/threonine protein kinase n=1 Tax=Leucocoprinus birnbaumii TaxID=56174 RepID=A0AAD5W0C4_9AGAR|nr:hypothetical protein NP233_g4856 [Leucocoprinus birnbaumii]
MATQQPYHAYTQQSKGTLMPGQTISVNKYTVQVERYLSQGGFAQVYLVRTQAPVYNTTHHVLKHVVVANESMLTEVKKEVDVMRLLRGHPNIVYLIDAAWAKMPNGAFEVYILMEYCPGGGIIDMMNRRLRERLTEAEILQIFVEVCEGVAHMHNSRPPLLHRDLKVENILQSSTTSFKLCDFGSTATVSKPPSNSQEMRALEADLNRHTTLQYRAPEMIDLHSRRPIDEKSDVWALGVLLYKLCYYTTPFEEHGPLAILNVQYRFPPYPVYSQQMMQLISSMLREHGPQRPTVFEVLANVHRLRGTKSAYNYPIPAPTPLSPRLSDFRSNPLDGVVTYRQSAPQIAPAQLSIKAVEPTVPPERRGRPKPMVSQVPSSSPLSSIKSAPQTHVEKNKLVDDTDFGADGNAAWSSAIAKHTSMTNQSGVGDDAWTVQPTPGLDKATKSTPLPSNAGFNDDFAQKLWASTTNANSIKPSAPTPSPRPQAYSPSPHPRPGIVGENAKPKPDLHLYVNKERDAFEGLGLMTPVSKPAPTLGEARKLRTGLAIMSTNVNRPIRPSPSPRLRPKAHTPRVSPIPPTRPLEPETSSWSSRPALDRANSSAESRFPSLEELDATFTPNSSSPGISSQPEVRSHSLSPEPPQLPPRPKVGTTGTGGETNGVASLLKPSLLGSSGGGTRSEQVTGFAMRDTKADMPRKSNDINLLSLNRQGQEKGDAQDLPGRSGKDTFNLSRSHLLQEAQSSRPTLGSGRGSEAKLSVLNNRDNNASQSRDLLTGDHETDLPRQMFDSKLGHDMFKIRDSPSKRASVIEQSDVLEATIPQQGHAPSPPAKSAPISASLTNSATTESPTVSRFIKAFPPLDTSVVTAQHSSGLTDNWSPVATTGSHTIVKDKDAREETGDSSSSEDEGPEEPAPVSSIPSRAKVGPQPKRKGRQSSVHDLVDLWGGGVANAKEKQPDATTPVKQNTGIKPRSAYMPQPKPASPPRKLSPRMSTATSNPPMASKADLIPQPSRGVSPSPSPRSARARPQSMFIFPSKSADNSAPSSATLLPPDDVAPRPGRRTSISDMVQRFEAIEASARVTGNAAPPSPLNPTRHLPSTGRDHTHESPIAHPTKGSLEIVAVPLPGLGSPSTSAGDPVKRRTSLTASSRPSFSSQRTSPNPSARSTNVRDSEAENNPPRPRNTSILRSEPVKLPIPSRKPVLSMEELTRQSQQEPAVSTPPPSNERSPSPERPYQGVGKLIDQWQKKSAEAEASRNVILSKRASLAPTKASWSRS